MKHWKPTGQTQQVWRFPTGLRFPFSFFFIRSNPPQNRPHSLAFSHFWFAIALQSLTAKNPPVPSWLLQHIRLEEGKQTGNQLPVANVARTSAGCSSN